MEIYEQKEYAKISKLTIDPRSQKNLRILRYLTQDFLFRTYYIEVEQLHHVAITNRTPQDQISDHAIGLWTQPVDNQAE